ncbi:hypothetical protein HMPREF3038_01914 [Akkermansia sp. KLE1797]|nr:hypothetical protein HMPREF3038_01914 [Akkermansia sp. KLE1797]KXU54640.1 hypothetical protein HMPREF3039_01111 [Akkermansia sp. KLE1798]KZA05984.1 hypothetical protein HMPREF1326_00246 [Akkermansia sp. KLE1605]
MEAALSRTSGLILLDIMLPHTQVHSPYGGCSHHHAHGKE